MDKEYRLSALRVRRNVLRAEMAEEELSDSDRYARVQRRIDELQSELADAATAP